MPLLTLCATLARAYRQLCAQTAGGPVFGSTAIHAPGFDLQATMEARWQEQLLVEEQGLDAVVYPPQGWTRGESPMRADSDSDLTSLEDHQGRLSPPSIAAPPLLVDPAPATAAAIAAAQAEHRRVKNRAKMANRRERETEAGIRPPRGEKYVKTAEPIATPGFSPLNAPHGSLGYVGTHDLGTDYNFLHGTPEEQLGQLSSHGYRIIDSPDVSL